MANSLQGFLDISQLSLKPSLSVRYFQAENHHHHAVHISSLSSQFRKKNTKLGEGNVFIRKVVIIENRY